MYRLAGLYIVSKISCERKNSDTYFSEQFKMLKFELLNTRENNMLIVCVMVSSVHM